MDGWSISGAHMRADARGAGRQKRAYEMLETLEIGERRHVDGIHYGRHDELSGTPGLYYVYDPKRPRLDNWVLDRWQARRELTNSLAIREEGKAPN